MVGIIAALRKRQYDTLACAVNFVTVVDVNGNEQPSESVSNDDLTLVSLSREAYYVPETLDLTLCPGNWCFVEDNPKAVPETTEKSTRAHPNPAPVRKKLTARKKATSSVNRFSNADEQAMRASALSKVPPIVERPKFSFSIEANANESVEAKVQTEDAVNRTVEMSQREINKEKRKPNGNTLQQKADIENMNAAKKAADKDVGRTNEAAGQAEKAKRKEMAKRRADQLKSMPSEAAFFRKSNDAAAKTRRKSVVDLTSPPPKSTVPSSGAAVPQHKRPKVRSQPRLQSASAAVSSSSATAASSSAAVPPHKRPKVRAQPRLQSSIAIGSSFKCSSFISFITRLSKSVLETDDVKALLMKESRAKFNDASDYCKYFIPLIQSEIKAMIVNAVSSKDYARVANPLHFESDVPRNIGGDFSIPKTCTGSRCIAPESIQGIMIEASLPDFRTKFSRENVAKI